MFCEADEELDLRVLGQYSNNLKNIWRIENEQGFIEFILDIRERFVTAVKRVPQQNELMANVIAFIEQNRNNPELTVSVIADIFQMSVSNLSHQFKAATNQNVSDCIIEKRFEYSRELLLNTDYSIQEIAELSGYDHSTSFFRGFKKYFGMTPTNYREKYKSRKDCV